MEPIKLSQGTAQRDDAGNLHIDQSGHHVILNAPDTALLRDYLQLPLPEITGPQPAKVERQKEEGRRKNKKTEGGNQ